MRSFASCYMTTAPRRPNFERRFVRLALVVFLLGTAHCSRPTEREIPLTRLSAGFEPLRAQFNRDAGKVRLLLLLDPT